MTVDKSFVVDCACLIHGNHYDWQYVDKLYNMLSRNFSYPIRLHVFTEMDRDVPDHMIKHAIDEWPGCSGPRRAWWYKIQLFNQRHFSGKLLYFDLDVVITGNLDWILQLDPKYFWCIRDFRYLWKQGWQGINSSVMYWDTEKFQRIWKSFVSQDLAEVMKRYPGDQDFLTSAINEHERRFFDQNLIQSWRWQINDGGMDLNTKIYRRPGAGSVLNSGVTVMVFHGNPKPHSINDPVIQQYWV